LAAKVLVGRRSLGVERTNPSPRLGRSARVARHNLTSSSVSLHLLLGAERGLNPSPIPPRGDCEGRVQYLQWPLCDVSIRPLTSTSARRGRLQPPNQTMVLQRIEGSSCRPLHEHDRLPKDIGQGRQGGSLCSRNRILRGNRRLISGQHKVPSAGPRFWASLRVQHH
jgi:hypothetical protein